MPETRTKVHRIKGCLTNAILLGITISQSLTSSLFPEHYMHSIFSSTSLLHSCIQSIPKFKLEKAPPLTKNFKKKYKIFDRAAIRERRRNMRFSLNEYNDRHGGSVTNLGWLPLPSNRSFRIIPSLGQDIQKAAASPSFLLLSGSIEGKYGRWNSKLEEDPRFGPDGGLSVVETMEQEGFGNPVGQILNLKAQALNDKGFVVNNLGGQNLAFHSVDMRNTQSGSIDHHFQDMGKIVIDGGMVCAKCYDFIHSTNFLVYSTGDQKLVKIDFLANLGRENFVQEIQPEFKIKEVSDLDVAVPKGRELELKSQYFVTTTVSGSKQFQIRDISDISTIIASGAYNSHAHMFTSLKGQFNPDFDAKTAREKQHECVYFSSKGPSAKVVNCFTPGIVKQSFDKVHGYYLIESFALVTGTTQVFSGAGDGALRLWDINSNLNNPDMIASHNYQRSILSIVYVPQVARVYFSLALPTIVETGITPFPLPSIISIAHCIVNDCVRCPDSANYCLQCKEGYANVGTHCLDCANSDLEEAEGPCNDIRRPWTIQREDVTNLRGGASRDARRDGNTGIIAFDDFNKAVDLTRSNALFRLLVFKDEYWKPRFKDKDIGAALWTKFDFQIEDVPKSSYNFSYFFHEEFIWLAINFTTDFNNKKMNFTLRETLLISSQYGEPQTEGPENYAKPLVLINKTVEFEISGREKVDEEQLEAFGLGGQIAGTVIQTVAIVTVSLAFFSVCFPCGIGAFILSFFQIIEIISRFSLINVKFGPLLQVLLENLDSALGLPEIPEDFFFDDSNGRYFITSRGKLSYYEVSVIVMSTIPLISFSYILLWLIYFLYSEYLKRRVAVDNKQLKILKKIKETKFLLYGMGILEFCLYSVHELTHHYQYKTTKDSTHKDPIRTFSFLPFLSYLIAMISFCLAMFETVEIIHYAKRVFCSEDMFAFVRGDDGEMIPVDASLLMAIGFEDSGVMEFKGKFDSSSHSSKSEIKDVTFYLNF
jgi:WD40 repeat protein